MSASVMAKEKSVLFLFFARAEALDLSRLKLITGYSSLEAASVS